MKLIRRAVFIGLPVIGLPVIGLLVTGISIAIDAPNTRAAASPLSPTLNKLLPAPMTLPPVAITPSGPLTTAETVGDPLGTFQAELESRYPNTFGGLYQNPNGGYDIVVVGGDRSLESTARTLFKLLPSEYHAPNSAKTSTLGFTGGKRSLKQLYAIRNQVMAEAKPTILSSTAATLRGVFSAGIDVINNTVRVETTTGPAVGGVGSTSSNLIGQPHDLTVAESQYGSALNVVTGKVPVQTNRTSDSVPWAGGDQMARPLGNGTWAICTLGFGVILASGGTFGISAGHCGQGAWFNTNANNPNETNFIGQTYQISTSGLDTQLIEGLTPDGQYAPSAFSDGIWVGPVGNSRFIVLDGWADPVDGAPVDAEGSVGGQISGNVVAVDQYWTSCPQSGGACEQLSYGVEVNRVIDFGDSGGPLLYPSIYGDLAGGTLNSSAPQGFYAEEIDPLLYSWSGRLGQSLQIHTLNN